MTADIARPAGAQGVAACRTPVLLAFDTSTEQLAVALVAGGTCEAVNTPGGALASAALLPLVHRLLAQAGLALGDLDAIAFGQGPGAFTGLRTACAVAQGLGLGLGCGLLPIDSLLIVAEDARWQAQGAGQPGQTDYRVEVATDARMQEAYAARYRHDGQGWQVEIAPALLGLPALAERAAAPGAPPARAGSAWVVHAAQLPAPQASTAAASCGDGLDRAAALGRLALAAWRSGPAIDPALALPVYLRDKVAQTSSERQAVREAKAEAHGTQGPK